MKPLIEKHVLKNAVDFGGKANPNAVLGKVLAEHPELKRDVPKLRAEIEAVIREAARLPPDEQRKRLQHLAPELLEQKEKPQEKELSLPGAVQGKVVMRF